MEQDRLCPSCGVGVSSDLSNCPLCGKHIGDKGEAKENARSYPVYDTKFVQTATWYSIIRCMFWLSALICVFVNLIFPTRPYFFPYVLAALIMVFYVFIKPLKLSVKEYVKNLAVASILVALFLIFVDAYNHGSLGTPFGWSICYASPMVMLAGVVASAIICFCCKRYESELLRSVMFMAVFSVIFFIVHICVFSELTSWASLALMCASVGLVVVLELFKRNKLISELSREFHL